MSKVISWSHLSFLVQTDLLSTVVTRNAEVQKAYDGRVGEISLAGLTTNLYPYRLERSIYHYVYWGEEWTVSRDEIAELVPAHLEFIVYTNPPEKRSVKNKPHQHIFIKSPCSLNHIAHILRGEELDNTRLTLEWKEEELALLYQSKVLSRWSSYRNTLQPERRDDFDRIALLLFYGGKVGCHNQATSQPQGILYVVRASSDLSSARFPAPDSSLSSTPFHPFLYDYLDFLMSSNSGDASYLSYSQTCQPWQLRQITVQIRK